MKWRRMAAADLEAVNALANIFHVTHFEDEQIFAERLLLYPAGCHVLDNDGGLAGYAVTHPWMFGEPPSLNSLLQALPPRPDTYYVHDVVLAAPARGQQAGGTIVAALKDHARALGLPNLSLLSLDVAVGFWQKHGFRLLAGAARADRLESYGGDVQFMVCPLTE